MKNPRTCNQNQLSNTFQTQNTNFSLENHAEIFNSWISRLLQKRQFIHPFQHPTVHIFIQMLTDSFTSKVTQFGASHHSLVSTWPTNAENLNNSESAPTLFFSSSVVKTVSVVQNILIGLKQRKYVYKLPCPIPSPPVQFSPQQLPTHTKTIQWGHSLRKTEI